MEVEVEEQGGEGDPAEGDPAEGDPGCVVVVVVDQEDPPTTHTATSSSSSPTSQQHATQEAKEGNVSVKMGTGRVIALGRHVGGSKR